jgi:hypothetical protein
MARRLNYFVPQGLRWITQPIFGYIFDKKILNLDTEHLKQVGRRVCMVGICCVYTMCIVCVLYAVHSVCLQCEYWACTVASV